MSSSKTRSAVDIEDQTASVGELLGPLGVRWKLIALSTALAGAVGLAAAYLLPATYTARAVIMPPQQQSSSAASALSSLGALAGLTGAGVRNPTEQYVALMGSTTVLDRLIDEFQLIKVYDEDLRSDARKVLEKNVMISVGKKDSLITIEVDDRSPDLAAKIANAFVVELRRFTNSLAVTEAQQRRVFFETQLQETKSRLTQAQIALQSSGYNPGALKVEPKAAAESYAKLRAEVTAAEVRLQGMRRMLSDTAPEVMQQQAMLSALRSELIKLERSAVDPVNPGLDGSADYITKFRDFKYQETLFELFARQYELARVDESREGALIQVVDIATPPEKKSKPKRSIYAGGGAIAGFLASILWILARSRRRDI